MSSVTQALATTYLTLRAQTAEDLMTANPVSIREGATIVEAIALLTDKGFSAAPVIDDAGRAIGVVSRGDIVAHDRESLAMASAGAASAKKDDTRVRDIMTPAVFSVTPQTPAATVVAEMVAMKIHRLFVVDRAGIVVGVISTLDILQRLEP